MADESEQDPISQRLVSDLQSLYVSPIEVPARLDDAILNRARAKLARRASRRPMRWIGGAAAAAACLLLLARVAYHVPSSNPDAGNGRVTIVDALILAKQIEAGKGRDINGDGVIDHRDVDMLAMAAVRLDDVGGMQ